jgi:cobalt-zinc-cadmium efflux system membrane fusion protein
MKKYIVIAYTAAVLLFACKDEKPAVSSGPVWRGDTVYVDPLSVLNSRIRLHTVELENFSAEFYTTGTVRAITGQIAEIAPLFDGRLTRSFIKLGQQVNHGDALFELYSAGFSEVLKNYFRALQEKKTAESNYNRQKDLVLNGTGVVREMEEAETYYQIAAGEYDYALSSLEILNIDPDKVRMGEALTILSPIDGEVVMTDMVIGQYVKNDAAPLAIVAGLDKIWVVAQVKEKYINSIRKDDKALIRTDAADGDVVEGSVSHISELLDEETRSVQVFISCENRDRTLKPGMFASVRLIGEPRERILIPSTALLQDGDVTYVFVRTQEGTYARRPVLASTADQVRALVSGGLERGDTIISEGGIYLSGK